MAFQLALLTSFLPTLMLSGFIFPDLRACRRSLQAVTYVVPARYFLVALRGIVLKGVGVAALLAASSSRWRCLRTVIAGAGVAAAAPAVGLMP